MKLAVTRTSLWDDETPPCEGAVKEPYLRADKRTFKTPEEYDAKLGGRWGNWFEQGQGHAYWDGGIVRYFPDHHWVIEIHDLVSLAKFVREHGECILGFEEGAMNLEIYDTYRE
jgi:hypothetical protein